MADDENARGSNIGLHNPLDIGSIVLPALQIGALTGTSGLVVGGVSGVLRSTTPVLFAAASGIQWFALGSIYWGVRSIILRSRDGENITSRDRLYASGLAGGFAGGSTAAVMRGRANILPGTFMFSLFGLAGQAIFNRLDTQQQSSSSDDAYSAGRDSMSQRLSKSKWSPVKVLSDTEYETMLQERLLRVNAEIAIIDTKIEELKASRDRAMGTTAVGNQDDNVSHLSK